MTEENFFDKKMSRREFLKKAGIGGAGLALGASAASAFFGQATEEARDSFDGDEEIPFYGKHQAGITTPVQKHVYLCILDLASTDKTSIQELFKDWTSYIAKMVEGELVKETEANSFRPPHDTGETVGIKPHRLTVTVGVAGTFLDKLGMSDKKPAALKDLPAFPRDQLREEFTGGDIIIQACSDDAQVSFHAVRNLVRKGRNLVTMKWSQAGFLAIGGRNQTPRNLFGFKDGTVQPDKKDYDNQLWVTDEGWLKGGSYFIIRKIAMYLETWDRTSLHEQEATFGRYKESGAPFGKKNEFDEVDLNLKDENGDPLIPVDSHVRLARESGAQILRRAYSYSDGLDSKTGQFNTGLLFLCFQKDPEQFVTIQKNLGSADKLNEYISHIGSGVFAAFPGVKKGGYLGQKLFE
ncbi:iron uptake transporter deferrochelatase/peroxidase subunit [Streptococcus caprae]|uniref:Deferrochelatase n=1 Tax=Streptococcus caprae TaxID=1640501 RepID=A0ABV8CXV9_9STRE